MMKSRGKTRKLSLFGRAFVYFIIFISSIIFGTILLNKSFVFENDKMIKYSEKSNVDYKVYLKKNDFYEQEYLGKDMLYVAALIDKIAIDFNYNFISEVEQDIDFTYSIVANLTINNPLGTKAYFEKSYTLVDNKKVSMLDSNIFDINEKINIDYPYYNSLANSFKTQYGVEADSKLTVYMLINKEGTDDSTLVLGTSSTMNVSVPLSERSVDIRLDYKEINETSTIIEKQNITVKDYIPLVISIVMIIIALVFMILFIRTASKMIKKKSAYDKNVKKLLKEYDRLIAESSTLISFEDKEVIHIGKFTELLDIHDNLQLPIMYYEVVPHEECVFYIAHDNLVYAYRMGVEDFEN